MLVRKVAACLVLAGCFVGCSGSQSESVGAARSAILLGPTITIGSVQTGFWYPDQNTITGGFNGVDPNLASVEINGLPATLDLVNETWEIDYQDILDELGHQSPQHPIRAVLFEAAFAGDPDPEVRAVDRVTFHDLDDYGVQRSPESDVHLDGALLRIEESLFEVLAQVIEEEVDAARVELVDDKIDEALDPDGPEFDYELPVKICSDMSSLGLTWEVLSIGPVDVGLSPTSFFGIGLGAVSICLEGVSVNVDEVDTSDFVSGNTVDADGDGVPDPFVAFDAKPGRLLAAVNTGEVSATATATLKLDIQVDPALSPFTFSLFDFEADCGLTLGVDHVGATVAMDVEPGSDASLISVEQIKDETSFALGTVSIDGTGICAPFDLNNVIPDPVDDLIEHAVAVWINGGFAQLSDSSNVITAGPNIPDLLEAQLEGVELTRVVPLGDASDPDTIELDFVGQFDAISEDELGITMRVKTNVQRVTGSDGPFAASVDYQHDSYYVANRAPNFGPMTPGTGVPYHFAPALAAGTMTQALQAAYNGGFFHDEVTTLDFQALGVCVPDGMGGCQEGELPLTADNLCFVIPQMCGLPSATTLELHYGPRLAPVVVVDDIPGNASLKLAFYHYELNVVEVGLLGTDLVQMTIVGDLEALISLDADAHGELGLTVDSITTSVALAKLNPLLDIAAGPTLAALTDGMTATMQNTSLEQVLPRVPLPTLSESFVSDTVWDFTFSLQEAWPRSNDETLYMNVQVQTQSPCAAHTTPAGCAVDTSCYWAPDHGGMCVDNATPNCNAINLQNVCESQQGCVWTLPRAPLPPAAGSCGYIPPAP